MKTLWIAVAVIISVILSLTGPAAADLSLGLVAYYPFDGNANDLSGNENHLVVHGNAPLVQDRFGNPESAYSLNGVDQFLSIQDHLQTGLDLEGDFTISLWVSLYELQGQMVSKYDYDINERSYGFEMTPTGRGHLNVSGDGVNPVNYYTDFYIYPMSAWTNVAVSFDISENSATFYMNGDPIAIDQGEYTITTLHDGIAPFAIGVYFRDGVPLGFLEGIFDDVRVYNRILSDEEVLSLYCDTDGDGFDSELCGGGDCNDTNETINPGALELCDGIDSDCDEILDGSEGLTKLCGETDIGQCTYGTENCTDNGDWVDCDALMPDEEICDGEDNDCDEETDEADAQGCDEYYLDADRDGYGLTGNTQCLCAPVEPYDVQVDGDCDDANADIHPGAQEVCNEVDDDCDNQTDEAGAQGCVNYYLDADRDGYGLLEENECLCIPLAPYDVTQSGDCNDSDASIHPGAVEDCNDLDDDCDGQTDEGEDNQGCTDYYLDEDEDGYGVTEDSKCFCHALNNYTTTAPGDCNDYDSNIHPTASETCNQIDDNCDEIIDPPNSGGCETYYRDEDGDGFGANGDTQCLCIPEYPYVEDAGGDCDDTDYNVNPSVEEECNGQDDDCDGDMLDGEDEDLDGDAYLGCDDCDDGNPVVNPGQIEICDNGIDDDCDQLIDAADTEDCSTTCFLVFILR